LLASKPRRSRLRRLTGRPSSVRCRSVWWNPRPVHDPRPCPHPGGRSVRPHRL
jgi:hypothetical protein